ncbi:MAG: hypothetical protein JSW11_17630 [Candidatus Heimdallarchaeota archaeon]|nr:MAG: hypothetical protein JSW11_17630 [Candidatus Heimdallarchaeota archaeon]
MAIDDKKLQNKITKENKATLKESELSTQQELPKARKLKEASVTELISFSKFTIIGVIIFFIGLFVQFMIQNPALPIPDPVRSRLVTAVMGITLLILFGGLVIDVLSWREYTEWGALGAIIAYVGVVLIFITFLLNIIWYGSDAEFIYIIMIIAGVFTMIIGFTTRATELDQKIVDQFFIFKEWIKAGGIRQALSALGQLIGTIGRGFFRYLGLGIKELGTRIRRFGGWITKSSRFVLERIGIFFIETLPKLIARSLIGLWNNLHWLGLMAIILYLIIIDIPVPNVDPLILKAELLIIIFFFFCLGVLYPQRVRVVHIAKNMRNTVLTGVISAYSMLSGTKIITDQSVFCSRCLRGVEIREFESLMVIKGMIDPPCPFCGYKSWIGSEHAKIPIDKLELKEKIEVSVSQESPIKDKPVSEMTTSDQKAMKRGRFPNFETYHRAQNLGAKTYSQLEFIDRLGAPNLITAEKIKEGGFTHFETYQKALTVGASSVSELFLVEEFQAPDLTTANAIQKGQFPDYESYKRAQELEVKDYSDLQYIDKYEAPDFETAEKIRIRGFRNFKEYEKAKSFGATNISELRLVEEFDAPDLATAEKIRQGRFPDYQTYKQGQDLGVKNYSDLKLIRHLGAPDLATAKIVEKNRFPDYKSYQRAQDLGARTYSELQFMTKEVVTKNDVGTGTQVVVTEEIKGVKSSKLVNESTDIEIEPVPKVIQEAEVPLMGKQLRREPFELTEDRESLKQAIEVFDYIFSNQSFQPKNNQELLAWNKKKSWFSTQKKRYLVGSVSAGMFYNKMKRLTEDLRTTFRIPEESFQMVEPQRPELPDLLNELLKASQRLGAVNKELKEWGDWLASQINLFLNSKLYENVFRNMLKRTLKFLVDFDVDRFFDEEKRVLQETITLITTILEIPKPWDQV